MARSIVHRGPDVTPRRHASVITLANIGFPFRKIEQMTSVKKSTAYSIFQHAVKNATQKRIEAIGSALSGQGGEQSCDVEQSRNAEQSHNAEQSRDAEQGRDDLDDFLAHSVQRLNLRESETPIVLVPGPELSVQELISQNVLSPKKRTGRPQTFTEAEKDRLVATVKRDFKARQMRLVDLRQEAGLSHVSDTTVFRAL
ncbi:hypothetical protein FN846DRAFT_915040 [Sphaerosporella brunnea]|uniref:Uncharacterized protein n=1 Tax=Sphaerosporella brunnea TaxID=1250544 RepID=A0A5J5EB27_9PEZI|nr:hypothetical protein FN846DRAFT_915040 [Sphaerosporella brunnea]